MRNRIVTVTALVALASLAAGARATDPRTGMRPAAQPAMPVAAPAVADLVVDSVQVNPQPREGQPVQGVSVVVKNQGRVAGSAGAVRLSCRAAAGVACPASLTSVMLPLAPLAPSAAATLIVPPNGRDVWPAGKFTLAAEIVGTSASKNVDLSVAKHLATERQSLNPQPEPPKPERAVVSPTSTPAAGLSPAASTPPVPPVTVRQGPLPPGPPPPPASSPLIPTKERVKVQGSVGIVYGVEDRTFAFVFFGADQKMNVTLNGAHMKPVGVEDYNLALDHSLKPGTKVTIRIEPAAIGSKGNLPSTLKPAWVITAVGMVGAQIQIAVAPTIAPNGDLQVTWNSGQPPYTLAVLRPKPNAPGNYDIAYEQKGISSTSATVPAASVSGGCVGCLVAVEYSTQLTFVEGQNLLAPNSGLGLVEITKVALAP